MNTAIIAANNAVQTATNNLGNLDTVSGSGNGFMVFVSFVVFSIIAFWAVSDVLSRY